MTLLYVKNTFYYSTGWGLWGDSRFIRYETRGRLSFDDNFVIVLWYLMAVVAQLVRAPACGAGGYEFKSHLSPIF